MTRILVALGLALAFAALLAGLTLADGGPHGGYDKLTDGTAGVTDACAACHRAHTAEHDDYLLVRDGVYATCAACHNGEGSRLDVLDGVKLDAVAAVRPEATNLYTDSILLGGGFEYVNGADITSRHDVQGLGTSETQPWGLDTAPGLLGGTLSKSLRCTSCHDPHGSSNYRILRDRVVISTTSAITVSVLAYDGGFTKDEGAPGLQPGAATGKYVQDYYASKGLDDSGGFNPDGDLVASAGLTTMNGMALLCGACHTAYPSRSAMGDMGNGGYYAAQERFRHRTEMPYTAWTNPRTGQPPANNPETNPFDPGPASDPFPALRLASNDVGATNTIVNCTTCHRAHGTATDMKGFAVTKTITDTEGTLYGANPLEVSPAQSATSKSTLLYLDNRGVCEACHQW